MRMLARCAVCVCLYLAVATLYSQTAAPTNQDAISACLTLERSLVIARGNNQAQDAASLLSAYNIIHKYVTEPSSLTGADEYMQHFASAYADVVTPAAPKPTGGFNYIPAATDLTFDQIHRSGVIVYDKNGNTENLHFASDKDSVTRLLRANGAVSAEAATR